MIPPRRPLPLALKHPLAIAMWDFSWLERRWPGAGYTDWDRALDALQERGYDALRIDCYPHLLAADPDHEWELIPLWAQQQWGAPTRLRIRPGPALLDFLTRCRTRGLRVLLSSWFRQDAEDQRLRILSASDHAAVWSQTLNYLDRAGVGDSVWAVDLCNEWPQKDWCPFFHPAPHDWTAARSRRWMAEALAAFRRAHPKMPATFSVNFPYGLCANAATEEARNPNLASLAGAGEAGWDFADPHLWMTSTCNFNSRVGYAFDFWASTSFDNLVAHGEKIYRSNPDFFQAALRQGIADCAAASVSAGIPLITTEGWGVVDYKDWPGLDWGWVKELCAVGTIAAADTGRWAAICTSNFCGPQFLGMWEDAAWHRRLTARIKAAALPCS